MRSTQSLTRWAWIVFWIAHALAAGVWWWLMPGGFPLTHPRFFANSLLPLIFIAAMVAALWGALKPVPILMRALLPIVPVAWVSATIATCLLFPVSGVRLLPFAGILSLIFARGAWAMAKTLRAIEKTSPKQRLWIPATLFALVLGIAMPWAQRAGPPQTRPVDAVIPPLSPSAEPMPAPVKLSARTNVYAFGNVVLAQGHVRLHIDPLLTFYSTSPDRCWTVFAKQDGPTSRPVIAWQREKDGALFQYGGTFPSALSVREESDSVQIESFTKLDQDVYSHLNAFSEISIKGQASLALEFSPCPDARIEVLPSDYPTGRPARSAYLDANGIFHVVEASSGEKGPFHELAAGALPPKTPLAITLFDGNRAFARLLFEDWAAQSSFELSPTAGWGLPANAIEFNRDGETPTSPCTIFLTLAATSVGRGWDSVGHARGTYRNRLRVEFLGE